MEEILQKIFPNSAEKAVDSVLNLYEKQGFVISNFIYFAIIKEQKLFESTKKTTLQKDYYKAITKGDFLLPDGIALQIFYRLANRRFSLATKNLSNLNGTDFIPYFLDEIKKRYGSQRISISLHGAKKEIVQELKHTLSYKGFDISYIQDGYSEFDRDEFKKTKNNNKETLNILLVARSTPTNPIQELRTIKNYYKIKESNLIVFTVGGLFDFLAGESPNSSVKKGTQKRAPKFVRTIKLERLWRFITDPKRNYKKVKNSFSLFPYIFRYLLLKKD
ncbi:MAG: WecB/TagA/CpsF family glycosyltransferase [Candidatus Absconditabacterales bacterium]|nr:WecB/TagA/CpsF family glycosyltransferase [Candidatus Absconditabacterales bacterium]